MRFYKIAFAGTEADIEKMKQGFRGPGAKPGGKDASSSSA
jgi:hypothetical protein